MFKAPFINIWAIVDEQRINISTRISSLHYDRDTEKEDMLKFSVEQDYTEDLDDLGLVAGTQLEFEYGFYAGLQSDLHKARITDVKEQYTKGKKVQLQIQARDNGTVLKKSTGAKVWQDVTTSDVAKVLANRWSMEYKGIDTDYIWSNYPQQNKSDWDFLQELCEKDKDKLICYATDGAIYVELRNLDSNSVRTYDYQKDNEFISIQISTKESPANTSSSGKVSTIGYDLDKGESIQQSTDAENDDTKATDKYSYVFSGDGEPVDEEEVDEEEIEGLETLGTFLDVGENIVMGTGSPEELLGAAGGKRQGGTIKRIIATIKVQGNPTFRLNNIITLQGLLQKRNGNYLIKAIKDEVSVNSGYTTTLTLQKNASKKAFKKQQEPNSEADTNTSVGTNVSEQNTKKVFIFDEDGNTVN